MPEKRVLAQKRVSYEGLFKIDEAYKLIMQWMADHGYGKNEASNMQQNTPKGKQIQIVMEPDKKYNDYCKFKIPIVFTCIDVQETTAEVNGVKTAFQRGKVDISVNQVMETDYDKKRENEPYQFFMRQFYDKFIFKKYLGEAEKAFSDEYSALYNEIKRYFDMMPKAK